MFVKPNILILDEPTRSIDVGAEYEIYTTMNRLIDQFYNVSTGRISGELPIQEATQEKIMHLATNEGG